jgi:uroporphyrinogen III methyltransferase / synthase
MRTRHPPLFSQTIVVTRAAHQSGDLTRRLVTQGAKVIDLPTICMRPVVGEEQEAADAALRDLAGQQYHAVVFTSANAVRFFAERWQALTLARLDPSISVFAVGPATAKEVRRCGMPVTAIAEEAIGESLVNCICQVMGSSLGGRRFLLPRAREGRRNVIAQLEERGAEIRSLTIYETVPIADGFQLPVDQRVDWITFASPSAVHGFLSRFVVPAGAKVACIGPVTAEAARNNGLEVAVVSNVHTAAGLVAAIVAARQ